MELQLSKRERVGGSLFRGEGRLAGGESCVDVKEDIDDIIFLRLERGEGEEKNSGEGRKVFLK